jgi:DinB superfamily
VADLLECLIQIKGVADTPRRLAVRLSAIGQLPIPDADTDRRTRAVAARMAAAEVIFGECLSRMLTAERPSLPALPGRRAASDDSSPVAETRALFESRRAETLRVLEQCSAGQLNRIGLEPSRGPMTVADLVAVMLAHDTDNLGELITR